MFNIICYGEVLWDNFKEGKKAGGAPMNVALHLHKQGMNSVMISSVGKDRDGMELLDFMRHQGLDTEYIQQHASLSTGIVEVQLDENHQATYTIVQPVAWDEIGPSTRVKELAQKADALVYGSLASRNEISRNTLLDLIQHASFRVFDMNLRPPHFTADTLLHLIKHCDLLKINEDELKFLEDLYDLPSSEYATNLLNLSKLLGIDSICLTLGGKGAIVVCESKVYTHPGFTVKVADTVGAGDAFLATYINCYLQKLSPEKTLELACAAGALVASRPGANPEYSYEDIRNHRYEINRQD